MNDLPEFAYHIEDNFIDYDTRSLLCGKTFTDYHKRILLAIIKYYASKDYKGCTVDEQNIITYLNSIFDKRPDVTYDELMNLFHATSNECLLAYILVAYNNDDFDLIKRCMYTFCRVLPFDTPDEWYDNYRLNNYGNPLNMIMYKKYDNPDVYTIDVDEPLPINESVDLGEGLYKKAARLLVGSLRAFIIDHDIFPENNNTIVKQPDIQTSQPMINHPTMGNNNRKHNVDRQRIYNHDSSNNTARQHVVNSDRQHVVNNTARQPASNNIVNNTAKQPLKSNAVRKQRSLTTSNIIRNSLSTKYSKLNNKFKHYYANVKPFAVTGVDIEPLLAEYGSHKFRYNYTDSRSKNLSAKDICDECYKRYPYFYGGCHGCDVFDTWLSLSLEEITKFLERYPSAKIGYILNSATYESGRGEHWVALELSKGKAKLICSQASDFTLFHDGGKLNRTLKGLLYGVSYNMTRIQFDSYNYGLFSALSLYELLITNSIAATVDRIGKNGGNIKSGKDIDDIRARWAGIRNKMSDINRSTSGQDTTAVRGGGN